MKFSTPFTLAAATTLFVIIGSTDAHLRGQRRSLETTDDDGIPHDCTGVYEDPWSSDSFVPCCAGLDEEQLWVAPSGDNYWKCMVKDHAPYKCYDAGGCPETGGALVKDCDNGYCCVKLGMGDWRICSDDNRMLEVKEVTGTSNNDDQRSLETTDDVGGACTGKDEDPWSSDSFVPCCDGLEEELNSGSASFCRRDEFSGCTYEDEDPWSSDSFVPCCDGLEEELNSGSASFCRRLPTRV